MLPAEQLNWVAVLCVHWPTASTESPVSVMVADADTDVFAWLVAVTVTVSTVLRGGTEMLIPEVGWPAVTETICAAGSAGTVVAEGAV